MKHCARTSGDATRQWTKKEQPERAAVSAQRTIKPQQHSGMHNPLALPFPALALALALPPLALTLSLAGSNVSAGGWSRHARATHRLIALPSATPSPSAPAT